MLTFLLSLCLGLLNGARGNGNTSKLVVIIAMILAAFGADVKDYLIVGFPIPLLISWWIPGGTGGYMKQVIKFLDFIPLDEGKRWRLFEISVVFLYSLTYFIIL